MFSVSERAPSSWLTNAWGRHDTETSPTLGRKRRKDNLRRVNMLVLVSLLGLAAMPANAYADPSGGALFQVLMPVLAAIWAMWMILANRVRRSLAKLLAKLRGSTPEVNGD